MQLYARYMLHDDILGADWVRFIVIPFEDFWDWNVCILSNYKIVSLKEGSEKNI